MLKHVTLFASENAMGLSLGLTHDVLAFASTLQKRLLGQPIDISLVTVDGEPTTTIRSSARYGFDYSSQYMGRGGYAADTTSSALP